SLLAFVSQTFAVLRPPFPVKPAAPSNGELIIIGNDSVLGSAKKRPLLYSRHSLAAGLSKVLLSGSSTCPLRLKKRLSETSGNLCLGAPKLSSPLSQTNAISLAAKFEVSELW